MNNQSQITQKQNAPKMLDCQYVSRFLFNRAEKYGYHALVCIIASALCVFLSGETSSLLIPIVLDLMIIIFGYLMRKNQSSAAKLRNYFDASVLGIKEDDYSETDLRNISNVIYNTVSKRTAERNIQVANTGRDNPPGIKDWYEFSKEYPGDEAVFECQRQNCWWNDALCKRRICITATAFVTASLTYWVIAHFLHAGPLQSIVCFLGIVLGLIEQFIDNCRYIMISKTMDDYIDLPGISQNNEQLEKLQELINRRRELPVLEMNWIHKKNAKKWSEKYEDISNH